jgi:anaerobic dimethyl sulfoxide reductase subunit B
MTRKSVFRDMDLCVNCKACIIACKVKHGSSPHVMGSIIAEPRGLNLIQVYPFGPETRNDRVIQAFVGIACMHCEDAACLKTCPSSAIYKDPQTCITLVDKKRCLGCKACLWACPFGVPSYDENGKLALCDLCLDRLQEGKKAACEAACQARAIFVGSPEEIKELRSRKAVKRMAESVGELGVG